MEQGLTDELKRAFTSLACRLSPENLACDGECSRRDVQRRRRAILREWAALEKKAGRTVSESELWI